MVRIYKQNIGPEQVAEGELGRGHQVHKTWKFRPPRFPELPDSADDVKAPFGSGQRREAGRRVYLRFFFRPSRRQSWLITSLPWNSGSSALRRKKCESWPLTWPRKMTTLPTRPFVWQEAICYVVFGSVIRSFLCVLPRPRLQLGPKDSIGKQSRDFPALR